MKIYSRYSKHKNTKSAQIKRFFFWFSVISIFCVFIFYLINSFSQNARKTQPTDLIQNINKAEINLAKNWIDVESALFCAREYYVIAKEDDIYLSYLNKTEIPEKYIIKTLYKLEKLGYKNTSILQDKFENNTPDFRKLFIKSLYYIIENLYNKSLKNYRKILALSPNILSAKDYFRIGMIYLKKNNFFTNTSIKYFNKSLESGLKNPELYLSLGNAYYKLGKYEKSLEYYKKANNFLEFNHIIKYNIAWIYHHLKKYDESNFICDNTIKKLKKHLNNDNSKFIIDNEKIINNTVPLISYKTLGDFYILQALNFEEKKEYIDALKYFKEAEKYIKFDDTIYQHLGIIYYNLKQYDNAKFYLDSAIKINPDNKIANDLLDKLKK